MKKLLAACVLLLTAFASDLSAQQYQRMDYGPFLSATFPVPGQPRNIAYRGIAVPFEVPVAGEISEGPFAPDGTGGRIRARGEDGGGKKKTVVAGTPDPELYRSPRTAFNGYQVNVPPGIYKVSLDFCEPTATASNRRVFDVDLQNKTVVKGLDIFERVGPDKALRMTFDNVKVKSGQQLVLNLHNRKGETLLCALAIEGKDFTRKIQCGGPGHKDYAADWPPGYDAIASLPKAGVLFDTEMLRYAAVWTKGFLKLDGVVFDGNHGTNPSPLGFSADGKTVQLQVTTLPTPGWAHDGSLKDPRELNQDPRPMKPASTAYGPLPREWARFKGVYRHDHGVLFKYTVDGSDVLDLPNFEVQDGIRIFTRTVMLSPHDRARQVVLADLDGANISKNDKNCVVLSNGGTDTCIALHGAPAGAELHILDARRVVLHLPPLKKEADLVKICHWTGSTAQTAKALVAFGKTPLPENLGPLTKGGKARFTQTVTTKGIRGKDNLGAYTVDSITVPFNNPYNSWMRFGGVDFFTDGRAAVTTWSGDVWIVSGLDDKLQSVTWKRFATGLFQPLGIKIVDDVIYVLGRDGVTRLHDLNGDGEADFYECFNNDFLVTKSFHEFIFDLHTDPQGNFYFIKGGPVKPGGGGWDEITPSHGCVFKLSKDGTKLEVVARGFRAPNGMSVGPHGEITTSDNEGTWTPQCPINWIKPGGFYGVPEFSQRSLRPTVRDNPLCWLPKVNPEVDNSSGGQVWITGDKFGPLSGQLLHAAYGTCSLFNVLKEEVGSQMQGGVVQIPLKFDSGIMRARFLEKQNVLYLVGLRGWQTTASKDAGFYRVRYTGQPAYLPVAMHVQPTTIKITFSDPLDRASVKELGNYNLERWNYKWTEVYGSPQVGRQHLKLKSAVLGPDGKTLTLEIEDLKPVMQMMIQYRLKTADGLPLRGQITHTINVVGDMRGEVHVGQYRIVKNE